MKRHIRELINGIRNRHILGFDLLVFLIIPFLAMTLRVESVAALSAFLLPLAVYTSCSLVWKLIAFYPMGLYNRYWRYASIDELASIVIANLISSVLGITVFFAILKPYGVFHDDFPRSIPIIDGMLTMLLAGGARFALRVGFDYNDKGNVSDRRKRVLIVGAGVAGSMVLKELKMNPQLAIDPVGFLDDDERKRHVRIHGVPVIGGLIELPKVVMEHAVQEVIIAIPTAMGRTIRDVVQMCKKVNVPSKTIPGIFEILNGTAKVSQIRDVEIEDLLRRGVVQTDTEGVGNLIKGSRVMVTGAGGSIGAEMCRQISKFEPSDLILVGHGETSIFNIAAELNSITSAVHGRNGSSMSHQMKIHPVIADIRDRERMRQVFQFHRPSVVFHAAAHKHVGLMELNIADAVTNNILGTQVLVDLADQLGVERFVMISSDKAVNPTCIMGVTKRVAELIVHEVAERTGRSFVSVRFGNVLGSRGSVVPIFKQQIANGGPVCITHPDVKRYFMTIPEAVQLVLQAATMGDGGEVFVLDMGEPIKIVDLARDLIRLSGLKEDIDIVYTGLQSGEKISEDLFFATESVEPSTHEKILVCRDERVAANDVQVLSNRIKPQSDLRNDVERLVGAAQTGASKNVRIMLRQIVPEYQDNIDIPAIEILPLKREPKRELSLVEEIFVK